MLDGQNQTSSGNGADVDVALIEKNTREVISVQIRTYKGKRFIDARVHVRSESGQLVPTQKGFGCNPEAARELAAALLAAVDKW